ncbi:toxin-activating lysine-acyltransferase [Pseudodonghicola flavimaris]|uniref:RTX toxin-activating lysine-acyltransferase n=1 Tax=Pseudodonghicola flavimaris TaxID=3050036 RepID=A0ABT7F3Z4_9RHOB|nr:toxin-activating lysine-acyltransferase [Pseudodonghicola flavimaris]MDK3019322.1 toxin-activating lysine-acyltransferase [Pseudodonghicola flavimaris]
MRVNFAGIGDRLPDPDTLDDLSLEACGAFTHLYMHSPAHRRQTLKELQMMLQPALDWGLYHIFRDAGGVPRAGVTWAWLNSDAQNRHVAGEFLAPADWRSGDRFWMIDFVAPFGPHCATAAMNWLRRNMPASITRVSYMRPSEDFGLPAKVVTCRRMANDRWGAEACSACDYVRASTLRRARWLH